MCDTQVISKQIGSIGRRSFDCRMNMASPMLVERHGEMTRLLNEVDKLCERLHREFPTITEEDYLQFGSKLKIVINTLKELYKESLARLDLKPYYSRMREQIFDLEELDRDIKTYRIDAPHNQELQLAMAAVKAVDLSFLFQ